MHSNTGMWYSFRKTTANEADAVVPEPEPEPAAEPEPEPEPEPVDSSGEELYTLRAIVADRVADNVEKEFKCSWEGFGPSSDT